MTTTKNQAARAKYDASLEVFRAASRAHRAAAEDYRARKIGDDEYLAARRTFDLAMKASDVAEAEFVAAVS